MVALDILLHTRAVVVKHAVKSQTLMTIGSLWCDLKPLINMSV